MLFRIFYACLGSFKHGEGPVANYIKLPTGSRERERERERAREREREENRCLVSQLFRNREKERESEKDSEA